MRRLLAFAGIVALLSCKTANRGSSDAQSVEDIQSSFKDPVTGLFHVVCVDGTQEQVTADQIRADDVCGGGQVPDSVTFYNSVDCSSGFMTQVGMVDDPAANEQRCASLSSAVTGQVKGVKLGNGNCEEIRFNSFANACRLFTGVHGKKKSVTAFHANTQCNDMIASVRYSGKTQADKGLCEKVGNLSNTQVQAVRRQDGDCEEIRFTSFANACHLFSGGGPAPGKDVTAFHANTQCNDMIASLSYSGALATDKELCALVGPLNNTQVQAVQLADGACQEIRFTSLAKACLAFPNSAPRAGMRFVEFYASSTCSVDLVAAVAFGSDVNTNKARCEVVGPTASVSVTGVRIDGGACQSTPSTTLQNSCLSFQ